MYNIPKTVTLNTSKAGSLVIKGILPGSEDKCHFSEIYQGNKGSWLIKVWKPNGGGANQHSLVETRYKTFCNLNFHRENELLCLPQEYVIFEGRPAYLMQHAPGEEMGDSWEKIKQSHLLQRLRIAKNIAEAVSVLHSRKIIHADIKPSNLFYEPHTYSIFVIDLDGGGYWGVEKDTHQFLPNAQYTGPYRPTEFSFFTWHDVWRNPDHRFHPDLWALAVLLYQILTTDRKNPFEKSVFFDSAKKKVLKWPTPTQEQIFEDLGLQETIPFFKQVFHPDIYVRPPKSIDDARFHGRPTAAHWKGLLRELIKKFVYISCPECGHKIEDLTLSICPRCAGKNKRIHLWGNNLCPNCRSRIPVRSPHDLSKSVFCPSCGKKVS